MPFIKYKPKKFNVDGMVVIDRANAIIDEYRAQGFVLTLRQIYYQFVARDFIPNTPASYKRLGIILNEARLAGLVDWDAIEDRTRNLNSPPAWSSVSDLLDACALQYQVDKWEGQKYRPEVWVEKEALAGVVDGIARELNIAYFSCRGYVSQSEMWSAAQRLNRTIQAGQVPVIIHLGDHDPSGIDMTRDIEDRLAMFIEVKRFPIRRVALNMDQIEEYDPPPNPAKTTDSRYEGYIELYGEDSWELDALEPRVMVDLIRNTVAGLCDDDLFDEKIAIEEKGKERLEDLAAAERRRGD